VTAELGDAGYKTEERTEQIGMKVEIGVRELGVRAIIS
jgi:hypothetical protein